MMEEIKSTDLTKEPPRSPHFRLGNYVMLPRTIDKCRALLAGKTGEYHFDCPVDNRLFSFKGIKANQIKDQVESGKTDHEILSWLNGSGIPRSEAEIKSWSAEMEALRPGNDIPPEQWFVDDCKKLGLDTKDTTLFDYLDADDKASFRK